MRLRRLAVVGLAVVMSLLAASSASAAVDMQAQAALLLDGTTGQILYQHNAQVRNFPASTTKLLTALVAVEHGKLDQMITVSEKAVDQPWDSSSCYLQAGEQEKLEHLLLGLMLASGNDCAIAIAEGVGNGDMQQFLGWMNETAKRLGAVKSNFTNPHGLHEPNHYTTALDLALIGRGALANPTVRQMASTKEFFWPGKSERNGVYYNHNQMLFFYDGIIGGKTGFTEEAGLTLVSAAERNGRYVVGVVMGEKLKAHQYNDMEALLDLGFTDFTTQVLLKKGATFGEVSVTEGEAASVTAALAQDYSASVPKNGSAALVTQPKLDASVKAPVTAGQQVGTLEVREGERVLAALPLVAIVSVEEETRVVAAVAGGALTAGKWLAIAFGSLFAFRIVVKTTRGFLRRSRRRSVGSRPLGGKNRGSFDMYRTKL